VPQSQVVMGQEATAAYLDQQEAMAVPQAQQVMNQAATAVFQAQAVIMEILPCQWQH